MLAWRIFVSLMLVVWGIFWTTKLVESIVTKDLFFGFFDYVFEEQMIKLLKVFAPLCVLLSLTMEEHLMIASVVIMAVIFIPYFVWFIALIFYTIAIEPIIDSVKKSIKTIKIARSK